MSTTKKKIRFAESEAGAEAKDALLALASDKAYSTGASYSANSTVHPDNLITFVEKHMNYLDTHPSVDPRQYLANLRLMTRLR